MIVIEVSCCISLFQLNMTLLTAAGYSEVGNMFMLFLELRLPLSNVNKVVCQEGLLSDFSVKQHIAVI